MATALDFLNDIGSDKAATAIKFGSVIENVLFAFGTAAVKSLQLNLASHVSSGALSDSIKFTVTGDNGKYTFELSLLNYYKWVDKGRAPGKFPPPAAILAWIGYKHLTTTELRAKPLSKGAHKPIALSERTKIKSLAFLIGRKIAKKGIKATNFYSSVINDQSLAKLQQLLQAALKRDILIQLSNNQ